MLRVLILPFPGYWYVGILWAILTSVPAVHLARQKNRSAGGWAFLCSLTALFFGALAFGWVAFLATRTKLSMRFKYLGMKMEERIADALKLPSPVGDDMEKRLLMALAYNPQGLRIGALGQAVGQSWRHIQETVDRLVALGKIRKEGDLYFFDMD